MVTRQGLMNNAQETIESTYPGRAEDFEPNRAKRIPAPLSKRILKITSISLLAVIGVLLLVNFLPGFSMLMVKSESMEPAFNMGDIIFTGPATGLLWKKVEPGTIITFQKGDALVSHRIVAINQDLITTKGDAMEHNDPLPVEMSDVRGVYLFRLPYVGYLTHFIGTKSGWTLLIIVPAIILVSLITKDIIKEALKPS